jgi:hypothetical protein
MNPVFAHINQNTTTKCRKIHRTQPAIARKVFAFLELTHLEKRKKSAREAAYLLEVPNSTMQSWGKQKASQKVPAELANFISTPTGADFLQRTIMAAIKLMKCGPGGIRGMQEFLRNSGLDHFVASSEGALQKFWVRCETDILAFGENEEKRLASTMRRRKITIGLDEMFRSRRPCLVAIDVVSNYILLEKFTEDRTADTWVRELKPRLDEVNIELGQVVSDLCGAIRSCTKELGAVHIPELFHAQYEIGKAASAALSSQERTAEKSLRESEERVMWAQGKYRRLGKEECERQRHYEVETETYQREKLKVDFEKKKKRREAMKSAIKEMGKIHHPIDLRTGKVQTAAVMEKRLNQQLKAALEMAKEAKLSKSSIGRIEKAKKAFGGIVAYLEYFFVFYTAFIDNLWLDPEQEKFFKEVVFPLCYLKMIWRRLKKAVQEEHGALLKLLETKIRDAPWLDEFKQEWMKKGLELAETFQRSSSCVEGRNGTLSLNHHRFHRLNARSLRVLTIVHNFDIRRSDGTTAAERFFDAKHANLFESLVTGVRIPGRPQHQKHDTQKRLLSRKERLVA